MNQCNFFVLCSTLIITSRFQEHLSCEENKKPSAHTSEGEMQRERSGAFTRARVKRAERHFTEDSCWQWCVQPLVTVHTQRLRDSEMQTYTRETFIVLRVSSCPRKDSNITLRWFICLLINASAFPFLSLTFVCKHIKRFMVMFYSPELIPFNTPSPARIKN